MMPDQKTPTLEINSSRHFPEWLRSTGGSIALSTYQTGKIFFLGIKPNGKLSVFERTMDRAMGMTVDGQELYLSTVYQIWRFRNALMPGQRHGEYDCVFLPRQSWISGDLDIHDMVVTKGEERERLVFTATQFNCIAELDDDHNFRPIWKPSWISKICPEDRCHLNGLALRDGIPRYVTSVSQSDVTDGWRDQRGSSGVVVDIQSNEIICDGLSMPHSPRWHNDELFVINSGEGEFGKINLDSGQFEPICFCPGYARGLTFFGKWAIIGLSDRRENRTFQGLYLDEKLKEKQTETRCGLLIVDLETGDSPHWLRFDGIVKELYDVAFLQGKQTPMAIGFKSDEVKHMISFPQDEEITLD